MSSNPNTSSSQPTVKVEYCGACDYGGHCLALAQRIIKSTPGANVSCTKGRRGAFEVAVNDTLVYSKLQTMALPNYEEVVEVVKEVSEGAIPRLIKGQQPIDCAFEVAVNDTLVYSKLQTMALPNYEEVVEVVKEVSEGAIPRLIKGQQPIDCAFEVAVNDTLVYSKLQTMALPNYEEVVEVVKEVSEGAIPRLIKGQQPIDCVIS